MNARRRTQAPKRRRRGSRKEQVTIGIICQGTITEKQYFDKLKSCLNWSNVQIEALAKDPGKLLDHAKALTNRDQQWDVVFLVVDVDNDNPETLRQVASRCQAAKGNTTYYLVVSNPAFEVWLNWHLQRATHFQELSKIQEYLWKEGVLKNLRSKRDQKSAKNAKHLHATFPIEDYKIAQSNAVTVELNEVGENPSSSVGKMIEEINKLVGRSMP